MKPDKNTKTAEAKDSESSHKPDRPATSEEGRAANESLNDPEVIADSEQAKRNISEMNRLGARVKGEGQIA